MAKARELDLKRSENAEDEAIANRLATALREDDVERFLRLYDEIPAGVSLERVSNIFRVNISIFSVCELSPEGAVEFISRTTGQYNCRVGNGYCIR